MAAINNIRVLRGGGLDTDSAPEDIAPNDYLDAVNLRTTGTGGQELGYGTNIESNELLSGGLLAGFNQGIGGGVFPDVGMAMCFRYQSTGKNQILIFNNATLTYSVVYEDLTDSAGIPLLPLTPDMWVTAVLINKTYAIWTAKGLEVGYTNLNTLMAGGYGTILAEDLMLLKPQCMVPVTGVYGSDAGKPSNLLFGKLPQFICQYVNADFNYSAWATRSKRMVPYQQNTPILGSNVAQNNYIIVSVYAGSIRAQMLNIACQFDDSGIFSTVKTVTRDYITALPNTAVNIATEIYEAYNPATNIYSFAFYNNDLTIPVTPTETDLLYDYLWFCNTNEVINGNIAALADWDIPYARPATSVTIGANGYNPNIAIPAGTYVNPLVMFGQYLGASGSGAGNHKRIMEFSLSGIPHTNDVVIIRIVDIRSAVSILDYSYPVPSSQDGDILAVVKSVTANISGASSASYVSDGGGAYTVTLTGPPYYGGQTFAVSLYFAGANVANSVSTVIDNTTYQLALAYFDASGRPFPIDTDNTFIIPTPSFAQVLGNAIQFTWQINTAVAPKGATGYQWMVTAPPVNKILDTTATLINYKGSWDAKSNTPALSVNSGAVGDTYQITTPVSPLDVTHYTNLGSGEDYKTGDYITNTGGTSGGVSYGLSYAVLPKTFGNLAGAGSILVFSLNPLALLNKEFSDVNVTTDLVYDFAEGDRCTLHYWIGSVGAINTYSITPGTGYTDGVYINIPLTGGTGTSAIATVTVAGNVVTAVSLSSLGTGYTIGDTLTGSVPGGTGWSITITALAINGKNYFNQLCIDLSVLGYDSGTYLVKVENSSALTFSGGHTYYNGQQIDMANVYIRLYSPAPINANQTDTVWYEVGERFTITNGNHDTLSGSFTDGGAYYKTRQFPDAVQPYSNPPVQVLAYDLNYSDFYLSAYWSKGRPRTFYDVLEQTEQKASIITSQNYILGSRINGLNRFYPANIYGEGNGQTSSSQGAIQIMWTRGNVLVIIQELGVFYGPVNEAYQVLNPQLTGVAISEKLLNNGRYSPENIGIGTAKESFWKRFDRGGFIAPYNSEPVEIGLDGIITISGKNSKYFKGLLQVAYAMGKRLMQYYDTYYEEVILCIQSRAGIIRLFPFGSDWNPNDSYTIAPGAFTAVNNGGHSTVVYDTVAGTATYTPATNYMGNDSAPFSFNPGSGVITKNNCLSWIAGNTTVNPFVFNPVTGQPLSTLVQSNSILVSGPNIAVPISITGGQYSINGGSFTSAAGMVNPGDTVIVEVMTSGSPSTAASTTLTISSTSATFTATTAATGHFTVSAQYGYTFTNVSNGTSTGVPASLAAISVAPGSNLVVDYSAASIVAGSMNFTITGMASIPGHVQVTCYVNGVVVQTIPVLYAGTYAINIGNSTSPTPVLLAVETF